MGSESDMTVSPYHKPEKNLLTTDLSMGVKNLQLAGAEDEWCSACLVHMHTPKNKMESYVTEWRSCRPDLLREFIRPEGINHL